MTSALRSRAMTKSTQEHPEGARVEPVLLPTGIEPPVVNDVVSESPPSSMQRFTRAIDAIVRRWGKRVFTGRQSQFLALLLVVLGMGLAVVLIGIALYFWPQTVTVAPTSVAQPTAASAVQPSASAQAVAPSVPASTPASQHSTTVDSHQPSKLEPVVAVPPSVAASQPLVEAAPAGVEVTATATIPAPNTSTAVTHDMTSPAAQGGPTWGADANVDSVPDTLERWLEGTLTSKVSQEQGKQYYRAVLPLADKLGLGIALSRNEKTRALRATECYLITAMKEGMAEPPNLNNPVLALGGQAADRMKLLFKELQSVDFVKSNNSSQDCS